MRLLPEIENLGLHWRWSGTALGKNSNSSIVPSYEGTAGIMGGFIDFTGAHVRRPSPLMWKKLKFFGVLTLRKKKWHRSKELTAVEFEPGTPGSEITEHPTKPQGSWRVQVIEKAICLFSRLSSELKTKMDRLYVLEDSVKSLFWKNSKPIRSLGHYARATRSGFYAR